MQKTHYLKRIKHGKIIQLYVVLEDKTKTGPRTRVAKVDVDRAYKNVIPYLRFTVPHDELCEIDLEEFRDICREHNCLSQKPMPAPQNSTSPHLV